MSDDLLELATRALRETSEAPNPRAGATRARLLASAERQTARRRGWTLRALLLGAGLLASGTAMAAHVAGGVPELLRALTPSWVQPAAQRTHKPAHKPARPLHAPASNRVLPAPAPPASAAPPSVTPMEPSAAQLDASSAPRHASERAHSPRKPRAKRTERAARAPRVESSPDAMGKAAPATPTESVAAPRPVERPSIAPELALFRHAERLHRAKSPDALSAWDAYLKLAPNGALAPEARYNRALCLVRMQRYDEARAALTPFAAATPGAYRQREARALLEHLPR